MIPELNKITEDKTFRHAFLCGLDRQDYSIIRMLIPDKISKLPIFKTGV
jgi:hypothetical protein